MIIIKHIYSRDLLVDGRIVSLWSLPKQANIYLNIRVTIGFDENSFEEVFDSAIITGSLVQKCAGAETDPYNGKVFTYPEFDPNFIKEDIYSKINACNMLDFSDSISELAKMMQWDFEGMQ
ncbi:Imm8 family immunity protein [Mesorhizobium sp. WSM3859]|uniref:Imm8 family immunity protein n=1 Tax=Mesorhizobium sp. WSM3859 TaxID=2029402 RepID=UPI001140C8A7|nr:Imm8 family immunity protein [Mesorhizobium sp. WSM3859]